LLSWTTASEQDNKQFDIEVSKDGLNFEVIGTIASQGNSIVARHYQFLHVKPQPGVSYYRIKQTDMDGKYSYSKIISLTVPSALAKASVYPVPAKDKITINFGAITAKGEIKIYSADMKVVKQVTLNGLSITKEINISSLGAGIYFIRYFNGTAAETLRFIKE